MPSDEHKKRAIALKVEELLSELGIINAIYPRREVRSKVGLKTARGSRIQMDFGPLRYLSDEGSTKQRVFEIIAK